MSLSYSHSSSDSHSETKAQYIMGKMTDDFGNIHYRGFAGLPWSLLQKVRDNVASLISMKAFKKLEVQFQWQFGSAAIAYQLSSDGTISMDRDSAKDNFYVIPSSASVHFVVEYDTTNRQASEFLNKEGWGTNGSFLPLPETGNGGYSSGGFGFYIQKKGTW